MVRPAIVTTQIDDSLCVIQPQGEHDISTAHHLRREVDRLSKTGTGIVLDLTGATFIDSAILGELIRAYQGATPNQKVAIVGPPDSAPARLFDLVDATHTCFPVFESLDAAIAWCSGQAALPAS
ncbi:MAG TPA: STAS domain-containing protein [Gaiellales bacterium]|nr:STAS domain-containing protein [Gaiellales bacterium]